MKDAAPVKVEIFNLKGQLVKTLVNETLPAGNHNLVWKGLDKKSTRLYTVSSRAVGVPDGSATIRWGG